MMVFVAATRAVPSSGRNAWTSALATGVDAPSAPAPSHARRPVLTSSEPPGGTTSRAT